MESGILGFGIWNALKESGVPLTIGIQNPVSTDKYWNPESTAWNPVRSQDCLGILYIGQFINSNLIIFSFFFFQFKCSRTILYTLRQAIATAHRLLKNCSPHFLSNLRATSRYHFKSVLLTFPYPGYILSWFIGTADTSTIKACALHINENLTALKENNSSDLRFVLVL